MQTNIGDYQLGTNLKFTTLKELPPTARGGHRTISAESLALQQKLETKKPVQIDGEFSKDEINSITQRLRTAAKRVGLDVRIRTRDGSISFQGYVKEEEAAINDQK